MPSIPSSDADPGQAPLSALSRVITSQPTFTELRERAARPVDTDGHRVAAIDAAWPFVVAAIADAGPVLAVVATGREATSLTTVLTEILGGDAVEHFPSWETLPHERLSPGVDTVGQRLRVLHRLASSTPPRVTVTAVRSLVQPLAPGLGQRVLRLTVGDEVDFDGVLGELVELAYSRVDMVARRGEFAVRGGILDVFPTTAEHPVRVEFWGDEVSEMRCFAVADQRSTDEVNEVDIFPCREVLLTPEVRRRAGELATLFAGDEALRKLSDSVAAGIPAEGMEALIPALVSDPDSDEMALLTDLVPAATRVVVFNPEKVRTRATDLATTGQEFLDASWAVAADGGHGPIDLSQLGLQRSAYRSIAEVAAAAHRAHLAWWDVAPWHSGDTDEFVVEASAAPAPRGNEKQHLETLAALRAHVATGGSAAVVVAGAGTANRFAEQLAAAEIAVTRGEFAPNTVALLRGSLETGVVVGDVVVLSETDLTGARVAGGGGQKLARKRRNQVDPLALTAGDLVVHDQHGIGRFVEMIERTVQGARREYLVIEYASSKRGHPGDRLFVPMDSLDQLSRYVGGEQPGLSKLGGSDWQNTKRKARKAVREIAGELVKLYAARQSAPGHAFAADTPWQRELEDAFEFTETEDQLTVISEVKRDMEQPVPMDRVIVGDVGYGKTEIAVRAAFKAVQDGRQVAVLVPTTILAQQHLQTFSDRMAGFPVRVAGLSRFTSAAESKKIIAGLADGEIDVVIGTHRLLQTGVRWKDLGLVIVDEEQRFGVEHKEHIKALRTHVDVLTMSATPIPRTLEMSMAGIREMSTILTPPEERHPVLTYVGPYAAKQVAAAIRRELLRDGQVFFVHNRVSSIDKTAAELADLVPEAKIAVAHGQMGEELLERTVNGFWEREYDVLVCTTIIETGLDISNANTLIVDRAENLGLSQLHQLRGRVGRSRERGYAYFLYDSGRPLTETAADRLATIAQNNELGAGMAVALKDLELRGAGNVLGAEQSGHIAGVGFDLYVRLVGEAVGAYRAALDGKPVVAEENREVRVDLPVDAHIPADYVDADRLRLEAYRKIAEAADDATLAAIVEELTDRYGTPPDEVLRLIAIARLRNLARPLGVTEIGLAGQQIKVSPLTLPDSLQVRIKRYFPAANYRATAHTVTVPLPRTGGVGSTRVRDIEVVAAAANLLLVLSGAEPGSISIAELPTVDAAQ